MGPLLPPIPELLQKLIFLEAQPDQFIVQPFACHQQGIAFGLPRLLGDRNVKPDGLAMPGDFDGFAGIEVSCAAAIWWD
jgi:hypothetical protein